MAPNTAPDMPRLPILLLSLGARHTVDLGDLTPSERRYLQGVMAQIAAVLGRGDIP